jgi:hypothetical protein
MKIFIWGIGHITTKCLEQNIFCDDEILGFIESKRTQNIYEGKNVYEPKEIINKEYDYIIVCAKDVGMQIKETIEEYGIHLAKVIFIYNWIWISGEEMSDYLPRNICRRISDEQKDEEIESKFPVLYKKYIEPSNRLGSRYIIIQRNGSDLNDPDELLKNEEFQINYMQTDYVRYRTFELVADLINRENVKGAIAELGVCRGDFALMINQKFKERKLYLFDTFESFEINEFNDEVSKGNCDEDFYDMFKETSEDFVFKRMKYRDNVAIYKGLFPQTAENIDDNFAFVSLDVDFEKSTLEGLRFFYPRLNTGGKIFVHDYNNWFLGGVKNAIETYELEIGQRLVKIPLCDEGGSLIICK